MSDAQIKEEFASLSIVKNEKYPDIDIEEWFSKKAEIEGHWFGDILPNAVSPFLHLCSYDPNIKNLLPVRKHGPGFLGAARGIGEILGLIGFLVRICKIPCCAAISKNCLVCASYA